MALTVGWALQILLLIHHLLFFSMDLYYVIYNVHVVKHYAIFAFGPIHQILALVAPAHMSLINTHADVSSEAMGLNF